MNKNETLLYFKLERRRELEDRHGTNENERTNSEQVLELVCIYNDNNHFDNSITIDALSTS